MRAGLLACIVALVLWGHAVVGVQPSLSAAGPAPATGPPTATSAPPATATPLPAATPIASGRGGNTPECPGEWDVPILWGHMCLDFSGIGAFINSLLAAAFGGLLAPILTPLLNALVVTPNFLDGSWHLVDAFFLHVSMAASGLFVGAVVYAAFRYLLQSIGQATTFYDALGGARRAFLGSVMLLAIHPVLSWWFSIVNALSTFINEFGYQHGISAVKVIADMFARQASGQTSLMILLIVVVATLLVLVIGIMRMMGVLMLAVLIPLAPLMVVCWVVPELRPVASWWLESVIGFSMWGIGYSVVLQVSAILLAVLPQESGFWSPALAPFFLLAVFFSLYSVPGLVHGAVGGAAFRASAIMLPVAMTLSSARLGLGRFVAIK